MKPQPGPILRWIASTLIRGPAAPCVLGDIDEAMRADLHRGMGLFTARRRYLTNVLTSSARLWWERVGTPSSSWRRGVSLLDVKLGFRALWKRPLISTVAVASLALGIPIGFAPSHFVGALQSPLPVPDGERVVALRFWNVEASRPATATSFDLALWREGLTSFEALAAVRAMEHNLDVGTGFGLPIHSAELTASAFSILREPPLLGRTFDAQDEQPGASRVVLIGYDVWASRFASDPEIVGKTVQIGGEAHTIIGVMREDFRFPRHQQMWLPLRETATWHPDGGQPLRVFGRLARAAAVGNAQVELDEIGRRTARDHPERYERLLPEVVPFATDSEGWPTAGLQSLAQVRLISAVGLLILVVACFNAGLLVLARSATRAAEIALRTALGASRRRIVTQVLVEALVLSMVAAGLGLLLFYGVAPILLETIWPSTSGRLPYWMDLNPRLDTVAWALLLAALSAVATSVLPALQVVRSEAVLGSQGWSGAGGGVRFGGMSTALVVADLAIAVGVVGAALGIGTRLQDMVNMQGDRVFPAERYLAVQLRRPPQAQLAVQGDTADMESRIAHSAAVELRLLDRLRTEPGVRGVAVASALPRMNHSRRNVEIDGELHPIDRAWIEPGFFRTFEAPVLAGREFDEGDLEGDRLGVIVNAAFQEHVLHGRNPLGLRLRYPSSGDTEPTFEIVGVAPDLGMDPLNPRGGAGVYHAVGPGELDPMQLAIHLGPDPGAFVPRLRTVVAQIDPTTILENPVPLDEVVLDSERGMVGVTVGLIALALILVAIAASGIYAIMSHTVAQRTREIGIRAALGASPTRVATTIGRRSVTHLMIGGVLGMPLAGWLFYLLQGDTSVTASSFAMATVSGLLIVAVVGLSACMAPLVRVLRILPVEAMKEAR